MTDKINNVGFIPTYYSFNFIAYVKASDLPYNFNDIFNSLGFRYLVSPIHRPTHLHRHSHYVFYFCFGEKISSKYLMDKILINYGFYNLIPCSNQRVAFYHLLGIKTLNYFVYDRDDIKAFGGLDVKALWDKAFLKGDNNG